MVVIAETQIYVEIHPAIAVERKIGRHHIAIFREISLGMDLSKMSDRYLETGMNLRRAKNAGLNSGSPASGSIAALQPS